MKTINYFLGCGLLVMTCLVHSGEGRECTNACYNDRDTCLNNKCRGLPAETQQNCVGSCQADYEECVDDCGEQVPGPLG